VYYHKQQITKGPALVLANHPNGFLDALLIAAYIKQPVYFLARGDVFNRYTNAILRFLHVLPVYRMREGIDQLGKNADTFDECQKRLVNGGTILIFAEGLCENNWDLRPMMKGAARIANRAWQLPETKQLKICTAGITYQHFDGLTKSVMLQYGNTYEQVDFPQDATFYATFMQHTYNALKLLVCYRPTMQPRSNEHMQWIQYWDAHNTKYNELPQLLQAFVHSDSVDIPTKNTRNKWIDRITQYSVFYDSVVYVSWLALFVFVECAAAVWLIIYLAGSLIIK
jgi:hypothetical protein